MVVVALALVAASAVWGFARLPTGFIPIEDQGYVLVAVQLPDGASLERTRGAGPGRRDRAADAGRRSGRRRSPASRRSTTAPRSPTPASPTSSSRTGASAARSAGSAAAVHRPATSAMRQARGRRASWCCCRRRSRASAMPAASRCRSSCATAASTRQAADIDQAIVAATRSTQSSSSA